MHPVLFSIGSFTVYTYGAVVAAGVLAAFWLAQVSARKMGLDAGATGDLVFLLFLSGIAGSRLWFVAQHWEDYHAHPVRIFMLHEGGLVWYGGFALAFLAGFGYAFRRKLPVLKLCDLFSAPLALGHAIGRLGCFLNGCCYGKPSGLFIAVRFPGDFTPRFPVQLAESAALFILSAALFRMLSGKHRDGNVFLRYLLFYAALRFILEFFRGDQTPIYFLTFAQWTSFFFLLAALFLFSFLKGTWKHSR